jgi:hypothetical protein
MIQYKYYKFPSEAEAPDVSEWPEGISVDVVGTIADFPVMYDGQGNIANSATYLDGWHVNVCYEGDKDLSFVQQYEITVNTPVRAWLGQPVWPKHTKDINKI